MCKFFCHFIIEKGGLEAQNFREVPILFIGQFSDEKYRYFTEEKMA